MINHIIKDNEKYKNNVIKKIQSFLFNVEKNWLFT